MNKQLFNTPQFWTVDELYAGQRIDNFLTTRLKGVPKSRIYRILRKGEVRVNKKRIKPDYRLVAGDSIRIPPIRVQETAAPTKPSESLQELLAGCVLYEDTGLLVLNKPAGLAVHGGSGVSIGVIEAVRFMRPREKFIELVHRLDRDTSGCLMLAKRPGVLKAIHALLREGLVDKYYSVLVKGYWPKDLKSVEAPLKKYELKSGERIVRIHPEGKPSETQFKVIQRFANATLLEAKLITGRTHQIRVHAAHAGHPVAGDEKYGDKEFNKELRAVGCKRMFLHSNCIKFTLDGKEYFMKAEVGEEWNECLEKLK